MANLKKRLSLVLGGVGALVVAAGTHTDGLLAQAPDTPKPRTFEVASVKPMPPLSELALQRARQLANSSTPPPPLFLGIRRLPGGGLSAATTVPRLIALAYGLKDYQIEGGPAWMGSDYFAIEARADGDATDDVFNEMLRALLADRFGLRTHRETRPGKVYALTLARADRRFGPDLKRTSSECITQIEERKKNPPAANTATANPSRAAGATPSISESAECDHYSSSFASSWRAIKFSGRPISTLIERISTDLAAPVVDRTGLEGLFDIVAEYEAPIQPSSRAGLDVDSTDSPRLPLPQALERRLGLKLESTTGDLSVIVIDAVQKPLPD